MHPGMYCAGPRERSFALYVILYFIALFILTCRVPLSLSLGAFTRPLLYYTSSYSPCIYIRLLFVYFSFEPFVYNKKIYSLSLCSSFYIRIYIFLLLIKRKMIVLFIFFISAKITQFLFLIPRIGPSICEAQQYCVYKKYNMNKREKNQSRFRSIKTTICHCECIALAYTYICSGEICVNEGVNVFGELSAYSAVSFLSRTQFVMQHIFSPPLMPPCNEHFIPAGRAHIFTGRSCVLHTLTQRRVLAPSSRFSRRAAIFPIQGIISLLFRRAFAAARAEAITHVCVYARFSCSLGRVL